MQVHYQFFAPTESQLENLPIIRKRRAFNVKQYVKLKVYLLDQYFKDNGIKAAVIGRSGGIDSETAYHILKEVKKLGNLQVIVPVCLPATSSIGVSNQISLVERVDRAEHGFTFDISKIVEDIREVEDILDKNIFNTNPWAAGQAVSYARTPVLYYLTSVLTASNYPAVVVGTTNRDEGAKLGYIAKAGDGMVDLQIISDLHKSEVREVAKYLGISQEILDQVPRGDLLDNRTDEELFGTTYDAVELYLNDALDGEQKENLDRLHAYNAHKYLGNSPAVHFDLYESGVAGGWPIQFETKYWTNLEKQGDIVKPCFVAPMGFVSIKFDSINYKEEIDKNVLLTDGEVEQLCKLFQQSTKKGANIFGYTGKGDEIYSERASLYNIELAKVLWNRLQENGMIDKKLIQAEYPETEWEKGEIYRLVGVNPLFRFIGYSNGGELVPHYDYSFKDDQYKSLFSLVIYLTTNRSGATLFHNDDQGLEWHKNLSDRPGYYNEALKYLPEKGTGLCFSHHLLHSGEKVKNEFKLIIRTDIMAEKIKHS